MRDTCDRCGREITATIYPIPTHFDVVWKFVCRDCYVKICRDNTMKEGKFVNFLHGRNYR